MGAIATRMRVLPKSLGRQGSLQATPSGHGRSRVRVARLPYLTTTEAAQLAEQADHWLGGERERGFTMPSAASTQHATQTQLLS